jgi:hypothetical protein
MRATGRIATWTSGWHAGNGLPGRWPPVIGFAGHFKKVWRREDTLAQVGAGSDTWEARQQGIIAAIVGQYLRTLAACLEVGGNLAAFFGCEHVVKVRA